MWYSDKMSMKRVDAIFDDLCKRKNLLVSEIFIAEITEPFLYFSIMTPPVRSMCIWYNFNFFMCMLRAISGLAQAMNNT